MAAHDHKYPGIVVAKLDQTELVRVWGRVGREEGTEGEENAGRREEEEGKRGCHWT